MLIAMLRLLIILHVIVVALGIQSKCGVRMIDLILNGYEAPRDFWPWAVALRSTSSGHLCSATLIGQQHVLLSAHCLFESSGDQQLDISKLYVALGSHEVSNRSPIEQHIRIERAIIHSGYKPADKDDWDNDLAILKLKSAVNSDHYREICLPDKEFDFSQTRRTCIVYGWGYKEVSKLTCERDWGKRFLSPNNICFGTPHESESKRKGTCEGDSGSPIMCKEFNQGWTVHGVVSWGSQVCMSRYAVAMDLYKYLPWIYSTLGLPQPKPTHRVSRQKPLPTTVRPPYKYIRKFPITRSPSRRAETTKRRPPYHHQPTRRYTKWSIRREVTTQLPVRPLVVRRSSTIKPISVAPSAELQTTPRYSARTARRRRPTQAPSWRRSLTTITVINTTTKVVASTPRPRLRRRCSKESFHIQRETEVMGMRIYKIIRNVSVIDCLKECCRNKYCSSIQYFYPSKAQPYCKHYRRTKCNVDKRFIRKKKGVTYIGLSKCLPANE